MAEQGPEREQDREQPEQSSEQPAPYTPASFEKRTAAWMGIAYVIILMFAVTYAIFTGGRILAGTFPLLLIPVAVAAIVVAIYRQRKGTAPGGLPLTIVIVIVCVAAVVLGVLLGVPALLAALRQPLG